MKKTTTLTRLCRQFPKNTTILKKSLLTIIGVLLLMSGFATNYTSNNVTGNWSNTTSWSPAGVPGASDNVTISQGTITVDVASSVAGIIISGGTLKLNNSLSVNGSWLYNSGTFTPNTQTVLFSTGSSIGGSSQTTFYGLTINTTNTTDIVNLTTGATIANNGVITFTKGILKLTGQTLSITKTAVINGNGGNFANGADGAGDTNADGGTMSLMGSSGGTTTVNGSVTFYNINTGTDGNVILDLQAATSIVNGTATIISQQGKFGNTNSPIWGPSSTLAILYKNSFNYTPGKEWVPVTGTQTASTPGYPNNVILSKTGTSAGGLGNGNGWVPTSGDYSIRGVLSIGDAVNGNAQIDFSKLTNFSCGGFVLTSTSRFSAPSSMTVNGNWTDNQAFAGTITNPTAGFNHNNGTVIFGGTGSCILPNTLTAVGTEAFNNLSVTNGAYVTLNSPVTISTTGVLALVAGVFKTSATNSITVLNPSTSAVAVSQAITAFISGPLTWNVAAAAGNYGFPVGTGCIPALGGLPFGLGKAPGATATVTVTPFSSNSGGTVDGSLSSLSTTEYWSLTSTSSLTGSVIALARATPVLAGTLIGESKTSANGIYSSIGGTSFSNGVSGSTDIGSGTSLFFALGQPPIVSTLSATSIDTAKATLNGAFNTQGTSLPTSFNYGTTISYGSTAPTQHTPINSNSSVADSAVITGLIANTVYHFIATDGVNNGSDLTFTTAPKSPVVGVGSNATTSGFTANWTVPTGQGTATYTYTVQVSTDPTFATGVTTQILIPSGTTYAFSGLISATAYYYRVQAVNATASSAWSATSAAVTTNLAPSPACTNNTGQDAATTYTNQAPVIDGSIDQVWANAPSNPINQTTLGTNNNTQSWKSLWTQDSLYLLVQVTDASLISQNPTLQGGVVVAGALPSTSNNYYEADGVEFYLNPDASTGNTYDGVNDVQLRFNLGSTTISGQSAGGATQFVGAAFLRDTSIVNWTMKIVPGGYILEAAMAWGKNNANPGVFLLPGGSYGVPQSGHNIGIDVNINDQDNVGGARQAQIQWFNNNTNAYNDPSQFSVSGLQVCPTPPAVSHPTKVLITATGANLGATVDSAGTDALLAPSLIASRGTAFSTSIPVTMNVQAEGGTALGTYSATRTGLAPQTKYYYVGYANNVAGLTGISGVDSFYTLSALPTTQPAFLPPTTCTGITLKWSTVRFPNTDSASLGGYLILRSEGGNNPNTAGIVTRQATTQTQLQSGTTLVGTVNGSATTTFTDLTAVAGMNYSYLLVPFTWDGNPLDSTYNYFIAGASSQSASIGVLTTPTFANKDTTICSGGTLLTAAFPTTSIEGITGAWTPSPISNTGTQIYTFTPATGQCANTATITITVTQKATPTFARHDTTICSGATVAALPTTSIEGITGTWAPVLTNTATQTYTFTPAGGQCANTATLTITLSTTTITPTFTTPDAICAGGSYTLPATSNNNIAGTWQQAFNNAATATYTYVPTAGQCAVNGSLTVTVIPIPHITSIAATPTTATPGTQITLTGASDADGGTYTWSAPGGFTASGATVVDNPNATTVYTLVVASGNCSADSTVTVTIGTGAPCVSPMKAFTPNGDGANEVWQIYDKGGCITTAVVSVYNRWGGLVYHNDDYKNDWDGTYKGSKLPDATYYYVIEFKLPGNNYTSSLTGNVTIIR